MDRIPESGLNKFSNPDVHGLVQRLARIPEIFPGDGDGDPIPQNLPSLYPPPRDYVRMGYVSSIIHDKSPPYDGNTGVLE